MNQLCKDSEIKSLAQLPNQFMLPWNNLLQYLQIRHDIKSHTQQEKIKRQSTSIESHFITVIEKHLPTNNHMSRIYR